MSYAGDKEKERERREEEREGTVMWEEREGGQKEREGREKEREKREEVGGGTVMWEEREEREENDLLGSSNAGRRGRDSKK